MKNVVKVFGAIVLALIIVIVWGFVQNQKVQSEVDKLEWDIDRVVTNYEDLFINVWWRTGANNILLLEDAREKLQNTRINIQLLEEHKSSIEEEIGKKWGEYNHYMDAATIIKQDIKDSMWLN